LAASGGFQLTDHLSDLDASFIPGKELDVFASPTEFVQKVRYWLAPDTERALSQRLAASGPSRSHDRSAGENADADYFSLMRISFWHLRS